MPPEVMQKLPPEMLTMLQKTCEILSEIEAAPLRTYKVSVEGGLYLLRSKPVEGGKIIIIVICIGKHG